MIKQYIIGHATADIFSNFAGESLNDCMDFLYHIQSH